MTEAQYDQQQLSEIVSLFNEAEEVIKYVEDFGENLIVPAVNQLRYTGNHLARYLSSPSEIQELRDAEKHAKRATYDAYEAAIFYHLLEYNKFCNDYRMVVVSQVIPDYSDIQAAIEKARSFVRLNGNNKTRGDNYKAGRNHLERIIRKTQRLHSSRDELNKLIKQERRNFLLAFIGCIVAIVGIALGLFQFFRCK